MRIALVCPYFPPNVGGVETYVYELAKRLQSDHTVYVFACGRGMTETYDGVKVFRLRAIDMQNLPLHLKIPYPVPLSLMFKLAKLNVDVIHIHGHAFATSFGAAFASQLAHRPLVLTIHDIGIAYQDYFLIRGVRPILDSILVDYVFGQADAVIAQNDVTYDYALRFKPKKIVIISSGVDCDKFKPRGEGEYVTFVAARLVPQKGGEIFIRAIPRVLEEIRDGKFMVVGDGLQRSFLEELSVDLGVRDYVDFVGSIPYGEIAAYLSQAKIVVFPSEIPTGLALLEVAAMRKPIITTRNKWAEDTLGNSPLFVPMHSPEETAKAIIHLLRNPDERAKIARSAYEKVTSERSWDTVAAKHLDLYNQVVGRNDR